MAETLALGELRESLPSKTVLLRHYLFWDSRMNIFGDGVFGRWLRLNAVV